jgi:hypothetical protein
MLTIFEWNGEDYEIKFEKEWPDEGIIIEAVDVGDVDDDGIAEVCVGTDVVHILQWNGITYVEEALLPTYGALAVVSIGDCDNDGINEINAGAVFTDNGQDHMYWIYKYGLEPNEKIQSTGDGRLKVLVKWSLLSTSLKNASVAAWNLETDTWYDIQPKPGVWSTYIRDKLPEGEYLLRVLMEPYKSQETTININSGQETTHTFFLKLSSKTRSTEVQNPTVNLINLILEKLKASFPLLFSIIENIK